MSLPEVEAEVTVGEAGVNFTNILCKAFMCPDPKSTKRTDDLNVIFALFGSALLKAVHKMLVKLTPRGNLCIS